MTITLDLQPEVEEQLRSEAAREGKPVEDLLAGWIQERARRSNGRPKVLDEEARIAAIERAHGSLRDMNYTVDDYLREKWEETARENSEP